MQFIFCAASQPCCYKLPQYLLKVPPKPMVATPESFQPWGNFEILFMKTEPVTKGRRPTSSWTRFKGNSPLSGAGQGFHNQDENHIVPPESGAWLKPVLLRIERSQLSWLWVPFPCSGEEPGWAGGAGKRRWMDKVDNLHEFEACQHTGNNNSYTDVSKIQ